MPLTAETQARGYRLLSLDETGSTNDDAVSAARAGDPGQLWIVARRQNAGRGRHGRQWVSPVGNLYASLLLIEPCEIAEASQLGFVAGLALHEALETLTGLSAPRLALKWPNDLLLEGAKLSGLLLEGHQIGSANTLAIVIGFGVNVTEAPTDTPYPTATLQGVKAALSADGVFSALSDSFSRIYSAWRSARWMRSADSFAAVRRLWLERAAGIGCEVTLRLPGGEKKGIFEGLDVGGRLQLKTEQGLEVIDAGDLYLSNLRG